MAFAKSLVQRTAVLKPWGRDQRPDPKSRLPANRASGPGLLRPLMLYRAQKDPKCFLTPTGLHL